MDTIGATASSGHGVAPPQKSQDNDPERDNPPKRNSLASERPSIFTKSLLLKIHCIVGMPSAMAQLKPSEGYFELVIQPKCKYYVEGHKLMSRELDKHVIRLLPSSISYFRDRYVVDFDGLSNSNGNGAAGVSGMGENSADFFECSNFHTGDKDSLGESGSYDETNHLLDLQWAQSKDFQNEILLQFPTRDDLKVIIDVCIGVRQVYSRFFSSRWLTPSVGGEMSNTDLFSMFLVSDGEVARHKIVHRSVGLQVGHLSCTISLPHVQRDLTQLPGSDQLIASAAQRLVHDAQMLSVLYPSRSGRVLAQQATIALFSQHLLRGESELLIYKNLLHQFSPNFYLLRVQELVREYPPTQHTVKWVRNATVDSLLKECKGREEELIRILCVELGPDKSSVSPRMRYRVFLLNTKLSEADVWKHTRSKWGKQYENDILDFEPDATMAELERHYGLKELLPSQYNFSKVWYRTDERVYFRDVLRFPNNSSEGRYRNQVLASRSQRVPLQMTPNERPLQPLDPHSRCTTEIEILLDKYKPEFLQIIPSIAEAMNAVVRGNEYLSNCTSHKSHKHEWGYAESNDDDVYSAFSVFNSSGRCEPYTAFLSHISEFTYVSPSVLLAVVIFLDRLCMRYQKLIISRHNIEKLFISTLRVSSKVLDLRSLNNRNFAQACSLTTKEMNIMEESMLKLMNIDFFLSAEELYSYVHLLDPPLRRNLVPSPLDINLPVLPHSSSSTNTASPIRGKQERQTVHPLPVPPPHSCHSQINPRSRCSNVSNGHEQPPQRNVHHASAPNCLMTLPVPQVQTHAYH